MSAITQYQVKRDPDKKPSGGSWQQVWRRVVAEDSLLSPFRLLLMLAILLTLVAAVLVSLAF